MKCPYKIFIASLPSLVTIIALLFGLSSVVFALHEDYSNSTMLLIVACFIDGFDGRIARMLNATSEFGAQLDSLADFANFGVIPTILLYVWFNDHFSCEEWLLYLTLFGFCTSMLLRLARFNVAIANKEKSDLQKKLDKMFFYGIPAPCSAGMMLLPIILHIILNAKNLLPVFNLYSCLIIPYWILIAILTISKVPTFSVKRFDIFGKSCFTSLIVIVGFLTTCAISPWFALLALGTLYLVSIFVSYVYFRILVSRDRQFR